MLGLAFGSSATSTTLTSPTPNIATTAGVLRSRLLAHPDGAQLALGADVYDGGDLGPVQ